MPPNPPSQCLGEKNSRGKPGGKEGQGTTPGCFGSMRGREVVGKGGSGQGFKDPKSQPRAAERGEGQSLWQDPLPSEALTMSFCLRKSSVNLAGRSPSRARASRSGHPPMPSHGLPPPSPCARRGSADRWKRLVLEISVPCPPVPPTSHAAAVKRFEMTTSSGFWLSNKCQKHATNVKQILPEPGKSSCRAATANETRLARAQSGTAPG